MAVHNDLNRSDPHVHVQMRKHPCFLMYMSMYMRKHTYAQNCSNNLHR